MKTKRHAFDNKDISRHFHDAFRAFLCERLFEAYVASPSEIKQLKERFINDMYAIVHGRFGVLVDTYGIAEHYGLDPNMLAMLIEYWEAKGFIVTYEGTFYASLTLKGVEFLENGTRRGVKDT